MVRREVRQVSMVEPDDAAGNSSRPGRLPAWARWAGWLVLPEMLLPAAAALAISGRPRRVLLLLLVCGLVTLLLVSPRLPKWLLPVRGKWLRRGLLGFMLLGLALAGPVSVLKRVLIFGWTIGQAQSKLLQSIPWRPYLRPLEPLLSTPVPVLSKLPLAVLVALLGGLALWQAWLLWRLMDEDGTARR